LPIDTIINQKGKGLVLYLRGHRPEALDGGKVVAVLEQHGAMEHTIVVVGLIERGRPP